MIYPNNPLYLLSLLGYIYYLTYYTLTTKDNINLLLYRISRRHPYNGWLGTLAVSPCYQTASQGALDFLFVQVTIALDALLMPMNGRLYYFDLTLKRVFVLLHT